ncbi:MAG: hypothetical protein ABR971_09975, partial [Acidobacteriaceae bacterium]
HQTSRTLVAMTMMVAIPAMAMMMVVVLRARCGHQRCEERKSKYSKRKLLHEIRSPFSLSFSNWKIKLPQQSTQFKSP